MALSPQRQQTLDAVVQQAINWQEGGPGWPTPLFPIYGTDAAFQLAADIDEYLTATYEGQVTWEVTVQDRTRLPNRPYYYVVVTVSQVT